jgi:hypothetical protein
MTYVSQLFLHQCEIAIGTPVALLLSDVFTTDQTKRKTDMKMKLFNAVIGASVLAFSVLPASAITYSLNTGNSAISGYTGPYGTVLVNLTDSTHATVTFTATTVGGYSFLFGGQGVVGVNVNASSWTLGAISGLNGGTGFTPGSFSNGGANNEDGFGVFNQTIDAFDGYTHSSDVVTFTLTDTSGSWASDADVLTGIAAHIFVTTNPADASNGAVATGYAAESVPDGGSTVALLGCGLAGIGMISRKFRKN